MTEGGSDTERLFSLKPEGLMEISRWRKPPVEALEEELAPEGATE